MISLVFPVFLCLLSYCRYFLEFLIFFTFIMYVKYEKIFFWVLWKFIKWNPLGKMCFLYYTFFLYFYQRIFNHIEDVFFCFTFITWQKQFQSIFKMFDRKSIIFWSQVLKVQSNSLPTKQSFSEFSKCYFSKFFFLLWSQSADKLTIHSVPCS